jgi:hypothetical protein
VAKPIFFWDLLRRLFFGALALLILFLFWFFAVFFLFFNLFIRWDRLWRWAGLVNLIGLRLLCGFETSTTRISSQLPRPTLTRALSRGIRVIVTSGQRTAGSMIRMIP